MRRRILQVGVAVLILIPILFIGYFFLFLQVARVPTGSMANTIIPGDRILIKTRAFGKIQRGDVILFNYPEDSVTYVARVIGLPFETILVRGRSVYINGKELPEQKIFVRTSDTLKPEALEEASTEGEGHYRVFYSEGELVDSEAPFATTEPFQIPENCYFVLGDNRDNSLDSRFRGPVFRDAVIGKTTMIYWSSNNETGNEEVRWERIFAEIK